MTASPFGVGKDGVTVSLRVTPRAGRGQIAGLARTADGTVELKIGVTAPPEDGKANAAVIKLLAKAWKVPKSSLSIIKGASDRRKIILVSDDAAALTRWLARKGT